MSTFKDGNGKEWRIEINHDQVRRVRKRLQNADGRPLDLYRLLSGNMKPLGELMEDVSLLVDTVWVLCSEQAEKDGVSDEQFGRALYGAGLERMMKAFLLALQDFFPSPAQQTLLRKMRETLDLAEKEQTKKLESFDVAKELEKMMAPANSNGSSTGLRESAASTPDPTRSAS